MRFIPPTYAATDEESSLVGQLNSAGSVSGRQAENISTYGSPISERAREKSALTRRSRSPTVQDTRTSRKRTPIVQDGKYLFYVRLREPDPDRIRTGYGWAVAQLHVSIQNVV